MGRVPEKDARRFRRRICCRYVRGPTKCIWMCHYFATCRGAISDRGSRTCCAIVGKPPPRPIRGCNLLNLDRRSDLALTALSQNVTPRDGPNASHVTDLTGSAEFLEELSSAPLIQNDHHRQNGTYRFFDRMEAIHSAQADITKYGATRSGETCIRRNAQAGALDVLRTDDVVGIWIPQNRRRRGTHRVLHDTGGSVIVENQCKLLRRHKARGRIRIRQEAASTPVAVTQNADKVESDNVSDAQSIPGNLLSLQIPPKSSASKDSIPSSAIPSVPSNGSIVLNLILRQSTDAVLVDSPTPSVPFDNDECEDAMLLESLPSACGFSDEQTQSPVYSSCSFF